MQAGIDRLTEPPRREWIMARVAALLSQYYAADVPQSIVQIMAEDWAAELEQWPEWTIEKAVRWWKSADNTYRKRRPVEGDISERAKHEFGVVRVAQLSVKRYRTGGEIEQDRQQDRPEPTPEQKERAAAMVAEVGANMSIA